MNSMQESNVVYREGRRKEKDEKKFRILIFNNIFFIKIYICH